MVREYHDIHDLDQIDFYIDYIEMIIEMFEKRGLDCSNLLRDFEELNQRKSVLKLKVISNK